MPTQPPDPYRPPSSPGSRTPRERIAEYAEAGSRLRAMTPDLIGLDLVRARWFAMLSGFSLTIASQVADGNAGRVLAQYPAAGQRSRRGARIQVVLSGPQVQIPEFRAQTEAAARERIRTIGLAVGHRDVEPSDGAAPGTILRTSPRSGSLVPVGTIVDYVVAAEPRASRDGPLGWDPVKLRSDPRDRDMPRFPRRAANGEQQILSRTSMTSLSS
jgi:hypothetical protein